MNRTLIGVALAAALGARGGSSDDPGTVSAPTIPDGAPRSLQATVDSETSATISWEAPAEAPDDEPYAYEVRRDGVVVRPFRGFAADDASATCYVDEFLVGGRAYTYEVVAIAYEDDARSPAASITLRTPGGYVPAADGSAPNVNVDNHVALLAYAFDVFNGSADGYGREILGLPGYSELRNADAMLFTVSPYANSMYGNFRVRSDATGNRMLRVHVVEELAFGPETYDEEEFDPALFTRGVLEIAGEDASALTLDAGTGERDTVEITLRAGETIETFTESWSPWEDSIQCSYNVGYGSEPLRGCLDPEG